MTEMGLVLKGEGAIGAYEYGAVTRLVELGWRPKAVNGGFNRSKKCGSDRSRQ
jgi:NTE family protein